MKFTLFIVAALILVALAHGDSEHKPEDPAPGVIDVTDSNVDSVINSETDALVEFYAPWCGHCKNLAHDYSVLGEAMLASKPKNVVVAKVNCVAEASVCSRYSVNGYPTIKFFAKGVAEDYSGGRSVDEFVDFLNKKTNARLRVSKAPTYVTDLTPANFDVVVNGERDVLVEFFAPWCGHCKSLAPKYELLGKAFANEDKVVIAKVDADKHRTLGERFGVSGFPTLKYFKGKTPQEFNRGSEEEMLKSVNSLAGTDRSLDGKLGEGAGRVAALDSLAKIFVASDAAKRKLLMKEAQDSKETTGQWYVKAMQKIIDSGADAAKIEKERIERIIASGATSPAQLDNFVIRRNILAQF